MPADSAGACEFVMRAHPHVDHAAVPLRAAGGGFLDNAYDLEQRSI
jgi:hypothetical protein